MQRLLRYAAYAVTQGGSWLTGSLALNDWPTIHDLVYGNGNLSGWLLDLNLAAPSGLDVFNKDNQDFYGSLLYGILAKAAKGLCDFYILSYFARRSCIRL